MSYDHHLPQFHVRLPRGYVNDPNGPIDIDGTLHLYFQSRPQVDLDVPVEWGHATSQDLIHWVLHRPAIAPVPGGTDSGGVWSGNTVDSDGQIRAYYSGKTDHNPYQSILLAVSEDGGFTYGPPVQVIADPDGGEGVTMFRDPFVWKTSHGWEMGVGAAEGNSTATIRRYRSVDGLTWEPAGHFATLARHTTPILDTGEGWECPQILRVDDTEIAIVGSWSHEDGPGPVLAFPLGQEKYHSRVDDGPNFYAASVMRDSTWGPILFGWITEGRDDTWTEKAGWSGAISTPRRTWLDDGQLRAEPHPSLDALRLDMSRPAHQAVIGAQAEIIVPDPVSGCVRLAFSDTEHVDIVLDTDNNTVTIDRDNASTDPRAHQGHAIAFDAFTSSGGARPALRVLVDGSVIEAFTSSGRVITTRVYPTQPPPWMIETPHLTMTHVWDLRTTIDATGRHVANTPTPALTSS